MLLVAGLFAATLINAQVSFGPKAGVNFSNLSNGAIIGKTQFEIGNSESSLRIGATAGIAADIAIGDMFSIAPELLYSMQGTTISGEILSDDVTLNYKVDYLNLPVMAKAKFGGEKIKAFIGAGPYVGFAVRKVTDLVFPGETKTNIGFDSNTDNRFDFGFVGGAGVMMPVGPGNITLEGRYGFGITNTSSDVNISENISNRVGSVLVGYMIEL